MTTLAPCTTCTHLIAKAAASCPHCGAPSQNTPTAQGTYRSAALGRLLILFAFLCGAVGFFILLTVGWQTAAPIFVIGTLANLRGSRMVFAARHSVRIIR